VIAKTKQELACRGFECRSGLAAYNRLTLTKILLDSSPPFGGVRNPALLGWAEGGGHAIARAG
jgi:hypothetical protein